MLQPDAPIGVPGCDELDQLAQLAQVEELCRHELQRLRLHLLLLLRLLLRLMLRLIMLCRREHGSQRGGGSVRLQRYVFIDAREERPSRNLDLDLLHQARRVDRGAVVSRLCYQ